MIVLCELTTLCFLCDSVTYNNYKLVCLDVVVCLSIKETEVVIHWLDARN